MSTLSGETTVIFIFALHPQEGFTHKGKNLLLMEQILSFKSRPVLGRAMSAKEANGKSRKIVSLSKNGG